MHTIISFIYNKFTKLFPLHRWLITLKIISFAIIGLLFLPQTAISSPPLLPLTYSWPTKIASPVLLSYNPPLRPWLPGHRGVKLYAPAHSPIYAIADGEVSFVGKTGHLFSISIQHDLIRSTYQSIKPAVTKGQKVKRGQVIGYILPHPNCKYSCLHLGIIRQSDQTYLNPMNFLAKPHIVLYPPS